MIHLGRLESCEICVAAIALCAGGDVRDRLAERRYSVVAGRAATSSRWRGSSVIEGTRRPGRGRAMTGIALGCRGNMGGWLCLGVLRNEPTAMAGNAFARHPGVIHRRRRPIGEAIDVAGIARSCRGNMGGRLGQCI